MNYFMRNNQTDFNMWCRHLVPYVLVQLKVYENDAVRLILHDDEYRDLLTVKKQLLAIKARLDRRHLEFFEDLILKRNLPDWGDKEKWCLYDEVYLCWQQVCFPNGKSRVKELDPVLLGGELKRLRIARGLYVKQVAELIVISSQALYAYEEGSREMRASTLYKLCQVYKIDLDKVTKDIRC